MIGDPDDEQEYDMTQWTEVLIAQHCQSEGAFLHIKTIIWMFSYCLTLTFTLNWQQFDG